MKVLLKKDVDNLGYAGEVFDVSPGYGRNYLIPQGFAIAATPGALKQAKKWMEQAAARREQLRQEYQALVERLKGSSITFYAKSGEKGRLYGSVTTEQIAEKIKDELGVEVERKRISVEGKAIRQVGSHNALVRLDSEFQATIKVNVLPEEVDVDEPVAAADDDMEEEIEEVVDAAEEATEEMAEAEIEDAADEVEAAA
ncbi:MAG: 50S ribosomal protein L9 [Chloroflexota bacterium]